MVKMKVFCTAFTLILLVLGVTALPQGEERTPRQNDEISKRKVHVEALPASVVQQGSRPISRQNPNFQRIGQPNVQLMDIPQQDDQGNVAVVRMSPGESQAQHSGVAVVRMPHGKSSDEDHEEKRRGGTIVVIQKPEQTEEPQEDEYWQEPRPEPRPQRPQRPQPVFQRRPQQYHPQQPQFPPQQPQFPSQQPQYSPKRPQYPPQQQQQQQYPQSFQNQQMNIPVAAPASLPSFGNFGILQPFKNAFANAPFIPSAPLPISRGFFAYQPSTPLGEMYAKKGDLLPSIFFTGLTIAGMIFLFQLLAGIFVMKKGIIASLLSNHDQNMAPPPLPITTTTLYTQPLSSPTVTAYSQATAKEGGQTEEKAGRQRRGASQKAAQPLFSSNTRTVESIMNALQAEQCVERLLCELGQFVKSQENSNRILSITRAILPSHLKSPMASFESTIKSMDKCHHLSCGKLPYNEKEL
ncbi:histone acetyltransferase KAT6A-like [Artemia franciscana]|uniref:Uncharacterized protein n=1 Tax=Artemia franciscana TaxID=6661 RepID=A0AA88I020_ARTSF|nr:hypothetical protein QYM36_009709 [Artemia franciscana]